MEECRGDIVMRGGNLKGTILPGVKRFCCDVKPNFFTATSHVETGVNINEY